MSCFSHTIANTTTTPMIMAPAGAGRLIAIAPPVYVAAAGLLTGAVPSLPTVVVMLTTVGVEAMVEVMEITVAGVPAGGEETTELGVLLDGDVAGVVVVETAGGGGEVVVVGTAGGGGEVVVVVFGGGAFEVDVGDNTGGGVAACWPLQKSMY